MLLRRGLRISRVEKEGFGGKSGGTAAFERSNRALDYHYMPESDAVV